MIFTTMEGKKYFLDLEINGYNLIMKVDSGCHDSIINKRTWKELGQPSLTNINTIRRSATGAEVGVKGGFNAKVLLAGREHHLSLLVSDNEKTRNLIGQRWFPTLMDIDWNIFFNHETITIRSNVPIRTKNKLKASAMTHRTRPFHLNVRIENIELRMMLDTGATSSIIQQSLWEELGSPALTPTTRVMRDTSNNIVELMGECNVKIEYMGQRAMLPLIVANGDRIEAVIGTRWFSVISFDFNSIFINMEFQLPVKFVEETREKQPIKERQKIVF
ncbi:Uncharacterized protein APZ42_020038 [Daphnia magna]|uniref:Peptidase A2 domain-containing protein n=1 Tax=Daphnia magna TaxID=35525 RepID=A0A164XY45_9CRUS|nr:Uncharacterized protein APZ42_020038 [Daphnia magna]